MNAKSTAPRGLEQILTGSILALQDGRRSSRRPEDRSLATDLLAELAPLLADLMEGADVSDRLVAVERFVGNRWFIDSAPFEEGLAKWHTFRKRYESVGAGDIPLSDPGDERVADASAELGHGDLLPVGSTREEPDLRVGGLSIWIHGRQYEDATEFWDANWLRVNARCAEGGGSVALHGPILHLTELEPFMEECAELHRTLDDTATLDCAEPNLGIRLSASDPRGGIRADVSLTPDHLRQEHTFAFDIDQSHLPDIISQIRAILERFPLRGERG